MSSVDEVEADWHRVASTPESLVAILRIHRDAALGRRAAGLNPLSVLPEDLTAAIGCIEELNQPR